MSIDCDDMQSGAGGFAARHHRKAVILCAMLPGAVLGQLAGS